VIRTMLAFPAVNSTFRGPYTPDTASGSPARRYAPNSRDVILHQATFAPYHYEAMFGCTGGDFCHGLIHPEQRVEFRPIPGWQGGYRTPVADLYLCGACCHPGPSVVFLPGYNAAHVVLADLGLPAERPA
jgi:phytoene dehydrogenase-like protein